MSQPQGHSAAGRIMSMKNFNDTIGNRTRNLPTYNAVPQPTALTRAPSSTIIRHKIMYFIWNEKKEKFLMNGSKISRIQLREECGIELLEKQMSGTNIRSRET
jgi:hypothetical protein